MAGTTIQQFAVVIRTVVSDAGEDFEEQQVDVFMFNGGEEADEFIDTDQKQFPGATYLITRRALSDEQEAIREVEALQSDEDFTDGIVEDLQEAGLMMVSAKVPTNNDFLDIWSEWPQNMLGD